MVQVCHSAEGRFRNTLREMRHEIREEERAEFTLRLRQDLRRGDVENAAYMLMGGANTEKLYPPLTADERKVLAKAERRFVELRR